MVKDAIADGRSKRSLSTQPDDFQSRSRLDSLVFDHRKGWVGVWDLARDLAILYSLTTSMFFLAFETPDIGMQTVDIIIWVFFVLDLFLRFLLSYEDDESRLVCSFHGIALQYCKTWFLPDLVAVIPLQFVGDAEVEYYLRMIRLLKISGALNLVDGTGLGAVLLLVSKRRGGKHNFALELTTKSIGSILFILILVTFYTYSMACLWFWFSKKVAGIPSVYFPTRGVTFGDFFPGASPWQQLERSWYFMITTLVTVGYGDLGPTNMYEALLLIFILFTGVTTYSYIIGQFNSLVAEFDSIESDRFADFTTWIERLENLNSRLPLDLKRKLLTEFGYYNSADRLKSMALRWWEADDMADLTEASDEYLKQLPESTLRDLKMYLFSDVFSRFRVFFGPEDFKYDVCFHFHPRKFSVGDFLLSEGEDVQEIFFSLTGEIGVGPLVASEFISVIQLSKRAIVGDYPALLHVPSFAYYRAIGTEAVTGFSLPTKPFLAILTEKYRSLLPRFIDFSRKRANFTRKAIEQHQKTTIWLPTDANTDGRPSIPRISIVATGEKRENNRKIDKITHEMVRNRQKMTIAGLGEVGERVEATGELFDGEFMGKRMRRLKRAGKILIREAKKGKKTRERLGGDGKK